MYLASRSIPNKHDSYKKALYFLHIPKTAGSSVSSYIDEQYQSRKILGPKTWNQFLKELPPKKWASHSKPMSKYDLIRGHYGWGALRQFRQKPIILTFLRDPLDRCISQYNHMMHDRLFNNWVDRSFYEQKSNKFEAMIKDDRCGFFTNCQSRYLAVQFDVIKIAKKHWRNHPHLLNYDSLDEFVHPSLSNQRLLTVAIDHLDKCSFVGIKEYFYESLWCLSFFFGWAKPLSIKSYQKMRLDKLISRDGLSESNISRLLEINSIDQKIYNHSLKQFKSKYAHLLAAIFGESISPQDIDENRQELLAKLHACQ